MKTKVKEILTYRTIYVACDGTEFESFEECKKYDESAEGVLLARYKQCVVKRVNEDDLWGGSCDDMIDIIKITTPADVQTIAQLMSIYYNNQHGIIERTIEMCEKAMHTSDYVYIYRGYDEDSFNGICTMSEKIEQIKRITTSE